MTDDITEAVRRFKQLAQEVEKLKSSPEGPAAIELSRSTTDTHEHTDTTATSTDDGIARYRDGDGYRFTQYRP